MQPATVLTNKRNHRDETSCKFEILRISWIPNGELNIENMAMSVYRKNTENGG